MLITENLRQGMRAARAGDRAGARAAFRSTLDLDPTNETALLWLGYLADDPEVVARLRGLDLKARMVVEGFLAGLHRSPFKGFSVEFSEHRPYMPGDEPRRVDWKVYAKTDRYYVREYEEETNLRAWLLLDASGSMAAPGRGISKLEYASWLAASIAWLLLHQRDSTGLVTFTEIDGAGLQSRLLGGGDTVADARVHDRRVDLRRAGAADFHQSQGSRAHPARP